MNRTLLPRFCAMTVAVLGSLYSVASAAQDTVTFAGWGGVTSEATLKGLFSPAKNLNLNVRSELHGGLPGLNAQVKGGRVAWDVVQYGFVDCERAARDGLLEPLDYGSVDVSQIDKQRYAKPDYVGVFAFSYGIAYNAKKFGSSPPATWKDFWDVKKYPGRRALFNAGTYVLEAALLADGVQDRDVYPMLKTQAGVDRAFKKLEEIKPSIAVWWNSSGQAMQLIRDGEVDMIMLANGRARALMQDGANVGFVWNQAMIEDECLAVPKGAKNKAAAMKLISASLQAEPQARFGALIDYGPVNQAAYSLGIMTADQVKQMPTAPANLSKQFVVSPEFYSSPEGRQAVERFTRFIQR
ncbi:Spermidine/putrescine-binding periplasmic protein precursor [Variovorax sp. SRS16]|uniref:ABC transporter substrate-binding protein n=1 Tax=Variovorax sp. SRS16 TaxID=282217 RepID=UPI001317CE07|nr:ABC transporter substrate-binding protein [Variovorax sp. SRS16]VTU14981.1 Spermidine/putrescine-binding periplasmic protein precursor [Variovorax sp. SRS16]